MNNTSAFQPEDCSLNYGIVYVPQLHDYNKFKIYIGSPVSKLWGKGEEGEGVNLNFKGQNS
jgi:hypothetical protein